MTAARKYLSLGVLSLAAALTLTGSAPAALLGDTLPGTVATNDKPSTCEAQTSQPFARWGDNANYVLMPGGTFEPSAPAWKLTGGAKIARGNEPYYVNAKTDAYSLTLPAGSSATTPPMCFAFGDWKLRFFAVGSSGKLRVKVNVKSALGLLSGLDAGTMTSGSKWQPSPEMQLLLTNISGLLAVESISLTFSPASSNTVRIDDGYLDPWKST
ncbi:MAG TPA: hypothetical protein VE615_12420 [Gaiellaceae bacterium]|jgi:hypothetical protein|nr:hypothetical protein [Gaiellaceae bacterium]